MDNFQEKIVENNTYVYMCWLSFLLNIWLSLQGIIMVFNLIIQGLIILHFVLLIPGLHDVLGGQDQELESLMLPSPTQDNL